MNAPMQNINFSVLSKGEQSVVYRIIQKEQTTHQITQKENQFINDMVARWERSKSIRKNRNSHFEI